MVHQGFYKGHRIGHVMFTEGEFFNYYSSSGIDFFFLLRVETVWNKGAAAKKYVMNRKDLQKDKKIIRISKPIVICIKI